MKNQIKPKSKAKPAAKSHTCPYCTPTDPENPCVFATVKTVIDGKEYSACCSNQLKKEESKKATKKLKRP